MIKEYLPYYIGQKLSLQEGEAINLGLYFPDVWTAEGNAEPNGVNVLFTEGVAKNKVYTMNFNQCKLILRPLSDMTEEEYSEWDNLNHPLHAGDVQTEATKQAKCTHYLLSRGFDIFGLCEKQLAITKTT